jgi:hypothetical protein
MVFSALFAVKRWFIHRMGIANVFGLGEGGDLHHKC